MKLSKSLPFLLSVFAVSCAGNGGLDSPEAGSSLTSITLNEPKNMQGAELVGNWTLGVWAETEAIKDNGELTKAVSERAFENGSVALTVKKDVTIEFEIKAIIEKDGEQIEVSSTKCTGERFSTKITSENQNLEIDVCSKENDQVGTASAEWTDIAIVPVLDFEKPAEETSEKRILENPETFSFTGVAGVSQNSGCPGHDIKVDEGAQSVRMTSNRSTFVALFNYQCEVVLTVKGYKPVDNSQAVKVEHKREAGTLTAGVTITAENFAAEWSGSWSSASSNVTPANMLNLPNDCEFSVTLNVKSSGNAIGQWAEFVMPALEACD